MTSESMPSDSRFAEFMELAVNQGIVIGPRAQTVLRATDLLRQYLGSPHAVTESNDGDPSRALMKVEIQVLLISLIRILQRLLSEQVESARSDLLDQTSQEKVLAELEPELCSIAKAFGLQPDELISLDLAPLGRFSLRTGV